MRKVESQKPSGHWRASDLRAVAQLATQATTAVTHIAEGVHQSVWGTMGLPGGKDDGQTRGLTRMVYQSVRGITQLVGNGLETVLKRLAPVLEIADDAAPGSPQREAVLAALNGVMGDRLQASANPLATPMTLRYQAQVLDWQALPAMPGATDKLLLLIHGLCMNDLQWSAHGHAEALVALGYTPVYLRYNSGRHISENGRELAAQLEQLLAHWPLPLQEITVVAHSMGGLLIRCALHDARQAKSRWPDLLKNIVFLGTPHHGAPLERAGNWVDVVLGSSPYTRPFARLAQLRSAGITDLRYGHVQDADWQGHERFRRKPDNRKLLPLPEGVACYTVAATTAAKRSLLADRLLGDGLVPLHSALGQHDYARRTLTFAKSAQYIVYRTSHMALLDSPAVTRQLVQWLTPVVRPV
jgi:pimeloyl-ACP methyl ester carboxylesterase